jgi:hypothetical protein
VTFGLPDLMAGQSWASGPVAETGELPPPHGAGGCGVEEDHSG